MRKGAGTLVDFLVMFIILLFIVGIILKFIFPFIGNFFAYINKTTFGQIFDALKSGLGF